MVDFIYPEDDTLALVEQELMPRLTAGRPIFQDFPIKNVEDDILDWEQRDNFKGLQQVRGLGGLPNRVNRAGAKRYRYEPGYYGEYQEIDERELTRRRKLGQISGRADVTDLVMNAQAELLQRRLDRVENTVWSILQGTFSVSQGSIVMHTDTFAVQTYSATVPWSTFATATPLANFRGVQLLHRGQSVSFGAGARAYMNQTTANNMLANTNTNDLAGKRAAGLSSIISVPEINVLLTADGLPSIVIYDEIYLDDSGTQHLFIPDNKVIVVGRRTTGSTVGEYRYTLNVNSGDGSSGPYMFVWDSATQNGGKPPRQIQVHDGHNGGPVIYHPGAIVVMSV